MGLITREADRGALLGRRAARIRQRLPEGPPEPSGSGYRTCELLAQQQG